jgi:carbon-monoxide dehydrogenase catalytic subunit
MGPCRIDPFGEGPQTGICGADREIMVARNLAREIAVGTSAHSDHGRDVAHTLELAVQGKGGYEITDPVKLFNLAKEWGIKTEGRPLLDIAKDISHIAQGEFGKQSGALRFVDRVPKKRREIWEKYNMVPRGIDREVVETLHRTHMGVDSDFKSILFQGMRCALADGWGGSMISTELQDILFKRPRPIRAKVNLGVLEKNQVNIVVHGHEPVLSMMLVKASREKDLIEKAKAVGAEGVNLAGICCTANEILMRHGVPIAGNHLHQELAIATGAVDAMITDVQCVMPAIYELSKCFHTKIISTSPKGRHKDSLYIEFKEETAYENARQIVAAAIDNFKNRDQSIVDIPTESMDLVAGFSTEEVFTFLGGKYRATYRPLNDGIMAGRLRGVVAIVGCNTPQVTQDYGHVTLARELMKKDVLIVETGCSAIACAKAGMLKPEAVYEFAGKGLIEICEAVGIPPILHLGSCVDISRVLTACAEMIKEGGIGHDFSDLPIAGAAPEWMSEKAVAIGHYVVATGGYTVLGNPLAIGGSPEVTKFLTEDIEEITGGKFAFEADPVKAAKLIIDHLDKKRTALNLKPMMYS